MATIVTIHLSQNIVIFGTSCKLTHKVPSNQHFNKIHYYAIVSQDNYPLVNVVQILTSAK